jgi:hypothetical protein
MKCKGFGPNHLESRCFSFQPLLTAARKGLFGLDEAEDDADAPANGSPQDKRTGPAAAEVQKEDEAAKSERSVSCGEPGGGDTDSDFW